MVAINHRQQSAVVFGALVAGMLFGATVVTVLMTAEEATAQSPTTYDHVIANTTTTGMSLYSGRPIHAEYLDVNTGLKGKMIDSITLKLRKVGPAPTGGWGTAEIGIVKPDGLGMLKVFDTLDVSTLTGTYTERTFEMGVYEPAHEIAGGELIGIRYTGGSADGSSSVNVMRDTNAPFEGANSYHKYYTTLSGWISQTTKDLYMILHYTPPKYVMIHFDDGWQSQYDNGLSKLEQYNVNATLFIVCNYANGIEGGSGPTGYMRWEDGFDEIDAFRDAGHSIQNHGENHTHYPQISASLIQSYVNNCEQGLINKGYSPIMFALPFNDGDELDWVMTNVEAALPSNAFGKGDNGYPQPYDCSTTLHDCSLMVGVSYNKDNRLTMIQWSHDCYRFYNPPGCPTAHTADQTFNQFKTVVGTSQVNDEGVLISLPIVTYHRVDAQGVTQAELATHLAHLQSEGFWTITADDIQYNTTTKKFELKVQG